MSKNRQFIRQSGEKGGFRGKNEDTQNQTDEQYDGDDELIDVVGELGSAQDFWKKNEKSIIGVLAGLLIIVGGFLAYKFMYVAPKSAEAVDAIHRAQYQFERDSFALALENPGGGYEGFLDIIDNYSGTPTGNLANYYAGISYLNLGKYEAAIEYLKDYDADDDVTAITKYGAMGDAKAELGENDAAIDLYKKAINQSENDFLTPYYLHKLALLYRAEGNNEEASKLFKRITKDFPDSAQATEAEFYVLN